VKTAIEQSEIQIGSQLPTEEEMCKQQGVSKAVVRSAMQELTRIGYVQKIPGKGTFVLKPAAAQGARLVLKLTENILDYGVNWTTEVVQKMSTVPPSDMTNFFKLETANQIFQITRIRHIKEEPVLLESAYISNDLCPGLAIEDLRTASLLDIIYNKYSVPFTRCADSIEVTKLEKRESDLLRKDEDDQALLHDRILYTTNDRVVAFIRNLCISKYHRITFESQRG
jgi:GntR family transcriptional regulator